MAETYGGHIRKSAKTQHTRVPTYPTKNLTVPSPHPIVYVATGYAIN